MKKLKRSSVKKAAPGGIVWVILAALAVWLIFSSAGPMLGWFLAGLAIGAIAGTLFGVWIMSDKKKDASGEEE